MPINAPLCTRPCTESRCRRARGSIRTCKVTISSGRKRIASGSARLRKGRKRSLTVKVKLDGKTQKRIAKLKHGLKITLQLSVTKFGSSASLTADASTTVLAPKRKH